MTGHQFRASLPHRLSSITRRLPLPVATLRQGFKAALAATLAMALVAVIGIPSGFWAPLSALAVLQAQIGASLVAARNYLIATTIGVILAVLLVSAFGDNLVVAGTGIFIIATLALAMRLPPAGASVAAGVVPVMVLTVTGNPWRYGVYRIGDIAIGLASAIIVSLLVWPARAVADLRREVTAAIDGATTLASKSLRDLAAGTTSSGGAELEARIRSQIQSAQALMPAARGEVLAAAASELLPFYIAHAERILEHASSVHEAACSELPRDAVTALSPRLAAVATAFDASAATVVAAVRAGVAGTVVADARMTSASLERALADLSSVDLTPWTQDPDLLTLHSLIIACRSLGTELERTIARIEQPERAADAVEQARLADPPAHMQDPRPVPAPTASSAANVDGKQR